MSEEPDYMSDEFLQSCINSASNERPGLIKSRKEQRQHDIMKNRMVSNKSKEDTKKNDITSLEEGLNKPINSENKGFLMIQKMGFKPGMGLGKSNTGITDPLGLSLKNDRKGLGTESKKQLLLKKKQKELEKREKMMNVDDFLANASKKHKEREVFGDLRKSERICYQLDIEAGIKEPEEEWFWPNEYLKKEEDEVSNVVEDDSEENDDLDKSEKLEVLTDYLRKTYFYCIWCGVKYADEKDLQDCPGNQRDLH